MRRNSLNLVWFLFGFVVVVVLVLQFGCATTEFQQVKRDGYRGLSVAETSYDLAMKGINKLFDNKFIDERTLVEGEKLGNYFYDLYQTATESFAIYAESGGKEGLDAQMQMIEAGKALGKFLAFVNPLLIKYGMPEVK